MIGEGASVGAESEVRSQRGNTYSVEDDLSHLDRDDV